MLLTDFRIQGFRCFEDLTLEGLGDVNLIVGKNSVGKSTLLDALWVYARRGELAVLEDVCLQRDEVIYDPSRASDHREHPDWKALFRHRPTKVSDQRLSLTGTEHSKSQELQLRMEPTFDAWQVRPASAFDGQLTLRQQLASAYVRAQLLDAMALAHFWNSIAGTQAEDVVVERLRLLNAGVSGVRFVPGSTGREWSPVVQLNDAVVPLRSLGDGAMRLFAISMAIAATSDGIVLIDEFENGLHWSVQPMIWRAIIDQAKKQNVQLFVTTHSSDTVNSFSDAVRERTDVEGALFRLEQTEGGIRSVRLNEQSLGVFREREWEAR